MTPAEQPTQTEIKYEVRFETNGGSKVAIQEVVEKGKVKIPTNPKKDGYTFEGWYSDRNLTREFIFTTNITDDIVLYAKWEKIQDEEQTAEQRIEEKILTDADEWAIEELNRAEEKGLIPETFSSMNATKPITRSEFAAVAVKLYEAISGKKAEPVAVNPFTDTNDEYVLKAYALGITLGTSETTFTPNVEITREQMATMLTRALNKAEIDVTVDLGNITKFLDDNDLNDWGRPSVYFMAKNEIIKGVGDNRFNAKGNAKVEEAIVVVLRSVDVFAK